MGAVGGNCLYRKISDMETMCYGRFAAMHTRFDILMWGAHFSRGMLGRIVDDCFSVVKDIDRMANRFDASSEVARLNNGDATPGEELLRLLSVCEKGKALTLGYFDIGAGKVPYDLSGVAKGYALECIRQSLRDYTGLNLLLNAGNSSVLALGHRPGFDCWPVALEEDLTRTFELRDECLSTSGLLRGMMPHIINPRSGILVDRCGMASVVTRDAIWGEILSTALVAAPRDETELILRNIPHREVVFTDF